MSTNRESSRYIGLFDRGYGREAIEIKLDYPFNGSGVIAQSTMTVSIEVSPQKGPRYTLVECIYVHSQQEAAKAWGIKQQDLSDCLARHREVQRKHGRLQ